MQARTAAAIARRPVAFLIANVVLAAVLGAIALGAPERAAVGGGLEREGDERTRLIVVLTPQGTLTDAVAREAEATVESGLRADEAVADVEALDDEEGDAVLIVTVLATTAAGGQEAAERVAERIDPGPFAVAVGGEPMVQAQVRDELEDELPGLALLALPLVLLVLGLAFGPRQMGAPLVAGATASLGGIALVRAVPDTLDLPAAGIAVAAVVGLAVAVEACLALRRAHSEASFAGPESMLAEAMSLALPRIAAAGAGGALAAATLFAIPLPAAHSAAVGGIGAALLAALSAPVAMGSVLALVPARPPGEPAPGGRPRWGPLERIADEISYRPWLAWIPAALALAALGAAVSQAFDPEATALTAAELGADAEAARVALLVADELPPDEVGPLTAGATADAASDLLAERLPWILGAITLLGLAAAYAGSRSPRAAIANGVGAALPSGAVCGLFAITGEAPHASVLLAAIAALGAVGVARGALPGTGGALAGSLVAGGAIAVLAGAELDAVAQAGVALAAGLAIDLVLVRAVLAPCLERALPARLA